MTKEEIDIAFQLVVTVLGGAIGGLVIMVVGNRLRGASDSAMKRKRFRSFITILRRRIESKIASDFVFSHEPREIPKLDSEILEVRHHIAFRLIGRFDAAVGTYKAASFDGWAGPDQKRQQERDMKNEKSKEELISSLDELYRCAWWMA
jgi:hypothetical protein